MSTPPTTLLVEGPDDKNVIGHLLAQYEFKFDATQILPSSKNTYTHPQYGALHIKDIGGIDGLIDEVTVQGKLPRLRLGAIADRDEDNAGQKDPWPRLKRILGSLGFVGINELPLEGLVAEGGPGKRIGVWIMPDNSQLGSIESFVGSLVPKSDALWLRARSVVSDIPEKQRLFGKNIAKAEIHTWLAWQAQPGKRMGSALGEKLLAHESEPGRTFVDWVIRLMTI